jgi:hypothetical protein
MKCPHCITEFHDNKEIIYLGQDIKGNWAIEKFKCPNPKCLNDIYFLINGELTRIGSSFSILQNRNGEELVLSRELVRPRGSSRPPVPIEVPKEIAKDYFEACLVLPDSTKASAALSRRALQAIIREVPDIKKGDLANEIQQLLNKNQLPNYLADSIDAIRNIGNFAAHPLKSTSTGEIVDVEHGEAEWNLDVIEMLFDFYYVQPEKTRQKREVLNQKLNDIGKPNMK